jgi:hypothetical protein
MSDPTVEAKTQLAFDTDWITAVLAAMIFVVFLVFAVGRARQILLNSPIKVNVTWETVLLFLAFTWFTVQLRERVPRFGSGLLAIELGSRIAFAVFHASTQTQLMNGRVMRVVDLAVTTGICIYIASWFKHRIRRV